MNQIPIKIHTNPHIMSKSSEIDMSLIAVVGALSK